ncbi:MAG: DUF362 domain-containing protein [Candidatus Hodarchaeales archaeon]|jgi:uncharacterized protein (DUF362 family)
MFVSLRQIEDLQSALGFLLPEERLITAETVFLKPNIGYPSPYPITTSLNSLQEVITYLKGIKSDLNIIVGEGSTSKTSAYENAEKLGIIRLLQEEKILFVDLDQDQHEIVEGIGIPNTIINADLRISLPCIKIYRHSEILMSCAVKNYLGIPPRSVHSEEKGYRRDSFHRDIARSVAEVYSKIQTKSPFELHVVDGTRILMGQENVGKEKKWGRILVGPDAEEIDVALCEKFGLNLPHYLFLVRDLSFESYDS